MLFEKENEILEVLSQRGCVVESNPNGEIKKLFILGMFWIKMLFSDLWDMIDYIGIISCENCEGEPYKDLYGIHQELVEEKTSYHIILLDVGAFECGKNYREKADFAMQFFYMSLHILHRGNTMTNSFHIWIFLLQNLMKKLKQI